MVTFSWTAYTEYLLQELQQHITRHTKVTIPDWVWGTTVKIKTDKADPYHSPTNPQRHCSLSHHNSPRGHSRSQHWDRHSHHRSSLWWSCSDLAQITVGHTHDHPTNLRHESCRSDSYSSRTRRRPHPKKNMKVKIEDLHTDYYSSDNHSSDSWEESDPLN